MYCITKWCAAITDSGEDEYTGRKPKLVKALKDKLGYVPELHCFRLLDDDGVIYGYGVSDNDSSFAPLDRYMYDYGCVDIQYYNKATRKYESL